jgi:hypothetical protein
VAAGDQRRIELLQNSNSIMNSIFFREYVLEYLAIILSAWYNNLIWIPKWILLIVTGGMATVIMSLLHRKPDVDSQSQPQSKPKLEAAAAPVTSAPSSSTSVSVGGKKGAKSRKGKK